MRLIEVPMSPPNRKWWEEQGVVPVVGLDERRIRVEGVEPFSYVPNDKGGYFCYRMLPAFTYLGAIYPYGVLETPTSQVHRLLSLARVALFPTATYPAPICYELKDGRLVHPGPCFGELRRVQVRTTKYHLSEDMARACCVCQGRFQ